MTPCSSMRGVPTSPAVRLRKLIQTLSAFFASTTHIRTRLAGAESLIVSVLETAPGVESVDETGGASEIEGVSVGAGGSDIEGVSVPGLTPPTPDAGDTCCMTHGKQSARVKPLTGGSNLVTRCCAGACQSRVISGCSGDCHGDLMNCAVELLKVAAHFAVWNFLRHAGIGRGSRGKPIVQIVSAMPRVIERRL